MGGVLSRLQRVLPLHTQQQDAQGCNLNTALAKELKGQKMHVDMTKSFKDWPRGKKNTHYHRLHQAVDKILERAITDAERCEKFRKSDFALFCSLWWPDAEWDNLYTAMLFTVWAFVWDDIIDSNAHALSEDFVKACVFRDQSRNYVRFSLELSPKDSEKPTCPHPVFSIFQEFAGRYCKVFSKEQRERMLNCILNFFEHSKLEQSERLANRLPSFDNYLYIRFGVTGVFMFSLLLEITLQINLPHWIMKVPEMASIVSECNLCIIIINDILSLKKEMATECIVNLVPILYQEGKPLDQIITLLVAGLKTSSSRFEEVARKLVELTRGTGNEQLKRDVVKWVDGCRIMVTGTLDYSIYGKRYDILQYLQNDGTLDIIL